MRKSCDVSASRDIWRRNPEALKFPARHTKKAGMPFIIWRVAQPARTKKRLPSIDHRHRNHHFPAIRIIEQKHWLYSKTAPK